MTADVELLPEPYGYLREQDGRLLMSIGPARPADRSGGYATPWVAMYDASRVRQATAAQSAEIEALRAEVTQEKWLRDRAEDRCVAVEDQREALRAEVERLNAIVAPKREEECLTLDHWRMRAYDLEANWERSSKTANKEAEDRKSAEQRAERLAEALQDFLDKTTDRIDYSRSSAGTIFDVVERARDLLR